LPQSRYVEESFHHNDAGKAGSLSPAVETAFGTGQKAVAAQAPVNRAAVEITRVGQRKRKTPEEAVTALPIDQTTGGQFLTAVTAPLQMPPLRQAPGA
jgi:hypothetical protein